MGLATQHTANMAEHTVLETERRFENATKKVTNPLTNPNMESERKLKRRFYLFLIFAWTSFLLTVFIGSYFLLPLVGITALSSLLYALVHAVGVIPSPIILISGAALASTVLATLAYYKPFTANLLFNFNKYPWREILPQVLANAYKNTHKEWAVSYWQIFNLVGHLYVLIGGAQYICNKLFHQLYNQEVVYQDGRAVKGQGLILVELKERSPAIKAMLAIPRFIAAFVFLILMLPLNLVGTLLEQLNQKLFNLAWWAFRHNDFLQAHQSELQSNGFFASLYCALTHTRNVGGIAEDIVQEQAEDFVAKAEADPRPVGITSNVADSLSSSRQREKVGDDEDEDEDEDDNVEVPQGQPKGKKLLAPTPAKFVVKRVDLEDQPHALIDNRQSFSPDSGLG